MSRMSYGPEKRVHPPPTPRYRPVGYALVFFN